MTAIVFTTPKWLAPSSYIMPGYVTLRYVCVTLVQGFTIFSFSLPEVMELVSSRSIALLNIFFLSSFLLLPSSLIVVLTQGFHVRVSLLYIQDAIYNSFLDFFFFCYFKGHFCFVFLISFCAYFLSCLHRVMW